MVDRDTGSSRGFGFVTMSSRKDAPKAIETLNGSELKGHNIVVNIATERGR
jgi:RNA recognition motif-containing protein